jgi:tRNA A-37 threonylcarbamoyl transferase component Bud32
LVTNLLPAGFVARDRGKFRVIAPHLELDEMETLLAAARSGVPGGTALEGGRGGARKLRLPGGKQVFLRKYLRGGFPSRFITDLFLLRPERPFRELVVTESARAAGCPVPTVLAVSVEDVGPFYRGWIVTEAIEPVRPLIDVWLDPAAAADRSELLGRVGRAIRSLHDAGVYHVDLTGHNIIVRENGEPVILDFDRGFFAPAGMARHAQRGLDRLWRSMTKLSKKAGRPLDDEARRWLDRGYRP